MAWQAVIQHGSSFANRTMRLLLLALFLFAFALVVLFATVGVAAHGTSGAILAGVFAVCCGFFGVRAPTSNCIDVTDSRLVVKSTLRNRSIAYTDLSHARIIIRTVGGYGLGDFPQVRLRLEYTSGTWWDVFAVNESVPNAEVIEKAANLINERIDVGQKLASP